MKASPILSSFNCGELSPLLAGRVDKPQYAKGCEILQNFIPTIQGPALRRGGSRWIDFSSSLGKTLSLRFSRSPTESYVLQFGDGILKFFFNGACVLSAPNTPYFINTPYTVDELYNEDGTPALSVAESIDQLYIAHPNHLPHILSFYGPLNWTLTTQDVAAGPWQDANPNENVTVYITGQVGIQNLVANADIFTAGMVGMKFRLTQSDLSNLKPWTPGEKNLAQGILRRAGYNTYLVSNTSAGMHPPGGTTLLYVQTGPVTPTHTQGKAWDGPQSTTLYPYNAATYYSEGVEWEYQDSGYGVMTITNVIDARNVQGTVNINFPAAVVGIANASWLWELGAWGDAAQFPTLVTFWQGRLVYLGGSRVWGSVSGDFSNFADLQFGQILADSAFTVPLLSDQLAPVRWVAPQDVLIVGTLAGEFVIGPNSTGQPFSPLNLQIQPQSSYGGRAVPAIREQTRTLFVQNNGLAMRQFNYVFANNAYESVDVTVNSEHLTQSGIVGSAWAKNPYRIVWVCLANGRLVSFTYNTEQEVYAWAPHNLEEGQVINVCCVPSSDGSVDDVYATVLRDDNGTPVYTLEKIEQPYLNLPSDKLYDMFYVDAGISFVNSQNAVLTYGAGAKGSQDVLFTGLFFSTDVGHFIHADYIITQTDDRGLDVEVTLTAIAQITAYNGANQVYATMLTDWPHIGGGTIAANGWRITVTHLTGLPPQWYGHVVSILGDGAAQADQVQTTVGELTLTIPASVVQCGLKSPAVLKTMRVEAGAADGTAQGKLKRIAKATIRFVNTIGGKLGRSFDSLFDLGLRQPGEDTNTAPLPFTGDTPRQTFPGDSDTFGQVMVVQDQPLPMTVAAIMPQLMTEDDS